MSTSLDRGRRGSSTTLPSSRSLPEDSKLQVLAKEYTTRLDSLFLQIQRIQESLSSDDLIKTMKQDLTTAQFVGARVKEICEVAVIQEQEATIERLIGEVTEARNEVNMLKRRTEEREKPTLDGSGGLKRELDLMQGQIGTEDLESRLSTTARELTRARFDLDQERETASSLHSENVLMRSKVHSLEISLDRLHSENAEIARERDDLKEKFEAKNEECEKVKNQVESYERERKELEGKYLSYSSEFKELLSASIGKQSQSYRDKAHRLKHKIVKQRDTIRTLEDAAIHLKADLDSVSGVKVKLETDLETRNLAFETLSRAKTGEIEQIKQENEVKIASIQLKMQQTMEERIMGIKSDFEELAKTAKAREDQLTRSLESQSSELHSSYITKQLHDQILSQELEKSRKRWTDERSSLEQVLTTESLSRVSALKDEFADERKRTFSRIAEMEAEKTEVVRKRKETEHMLEEAELRIRELNSRLTKTSLELETAGEQKEAMLRRLEETEAVVEKEKGLYDKEFAQRLKTEGEITRLKSEIASKNAQLEDLERNLSEEKVHFSLKSKEVKAQIDLLTQELANTQRDLKESQQKIQNLEEEKATSLTKVSQASMDQLIFLGQVREQEKQSFKAESEAYHQSKSDLKRQVEALRTENERVKMRGRRALEKVVKTCRADLRDMRRAMGLEMAEFRRGLNSTLTDAVLEVDKNQLLHERRHAALLSSSQDLLSTLQRDNESLRLSAEKDLNDQSHSYEHKIRSLESVLDQLKSQISGKNRELDGILTKLETFKERETDLLSRNGNYEEELRTAREDLEAWKSSSMIGEERNSALGNRIREVEQVVETLKERNERNMRYFEDQIRTLGDQYRERDEQRGIETHKLLLGKQTELHQIAQELISLKSSTESIFKSIESDLFSLLKSVQTDETRNSVALQRVKTDSEAQNRGFRLLQERNEELSSILEQREKERNSLIVELRETKDEVVKMQLQEVRAEMARTEAAMKEGKEK